MTWAEFKDFLRKNLGDSRAFVNSIWKRVKRNSQYQDKLVQDWAAYLEYLQFMLIEFNPECAPEEGTMIWYFREGLCPSIRVEMEQCGRELDSFKELVKNAVDAEARATLRPRSYARETDQSFLRDSRPSAAKASTQGQPMKDLRVKELKSRPQKSKAPAFQRSDSAETSKKARKEKKKNNRQNKRDCRARKGSTPATEVNTTDANDSKKKKTAPTAATLARLSITIVTKKAIIWTSAPSHQSQKTSTGLGNLCVGDWD